MNVSNAKLAYLEIFDGFAVDTKDVAKLLNTTVPVAYAICRDLESKNLVTGMNQDESGVIRGERSNKNPHNNRSILWQCMETYDSITRQEAEERFYAAYPLERSPMAAPKPAKVQRASKITKLDMGACATARFVDTENGERAMLAVVNPDGAGMVLEMSFTQAKALEAMLRKYLDS